jgi:hypothetical protein
MARSAADGIGDIYDVFVRDPCPAEDLGHTSNVVAAVAQFFRETPLHHSLVKNERHSLLPKFG